jgi:ADP-ribose pyrophosphatase YjhB (NUDIX family)
MKREREPSGDATVRLLPPAACYEGPARAYAAPVHVEGDQLAMITVPATSAKGGSTPVTFGHHVLVARTGVPEFSTASFGFIGVLDVKPSAFDSGQDAKLSGAMAAPYSKPGTRQLYAAPYCELAAAACNDQPRGTDESAFVDVFWASYLAFCNRPAFQSALELAKQSGALAPVHRERKMLKVANYKLDLVPSERRHYDARLNSYVLLMNSSRQPSPPYSLSISEISGGKPTKEGHKTPYRIDLKRAKGKNPEARYIEAFGSTLISLFPEEALDVDKKGAPALRAQTVVANLKSVGDALLVLGGVDSSRTSLRAVIRDFGAGQHVALRSNAFKCRFNDALQALTVPGTHRTDASLQCQLRRGQIVPMIGSSLRYKDDKDDAVLLCQQHVRDALGAEAIAALQSADATEEPAADPCAARLLALSDVELLKLRPRMQQRAEEQVTLDEFIDVEGLEEALRQVRGILETATGREQRRAQSFQQYLLQLREACERDGSPEVDGPMGFKCYKLPVRYSQKRGYGRLNTQNARVFEDFYKNEKRVLCLQGCPRLLRPYLCGRFSEDYDIVNAQPTILLQLAKRLRNGSHRMPTLQDWVEDRPKFIAHIAEVHDITEDVKDTVKELVISLIFGGEYDHWIEKRHMPVDIQSPLVKRLARELADLRATVFDHPEFHERVRQERDRHAKEGRKDPAAADRSIFAVLAQHAENEILTVIRDGVAKQGFGVESLQFDGLFVLRRTDGVQLDVAPIEVEIQKRLGYEIRIAEKELFFEGAWPTLSLGNATSTSSNPHASSGSGPNRTGGLGPVMDPAVVADVDATDADAVHRAILAGLDENVLAGGFVLLQGGGIWLARQTMPGAAPALGDLGGKKKRNETLWEAAVRETREEGGVDLSSVRLASTEQVFYSCKRTGERSYVFFFLATEDAPRWTGDKRIEEHCHFKTLPDWPKLHPRMRFATGFRARMQQCLCECRAPF